MENSSLDEFGEYNEITSPEDVEDEEVMNRKRARVRKEEEEVQLSKYLRDIKFRWY